jgi:hypothetical protein
MNNARAQPRLRVRHNEKLLDPRLSVVPAGRVRRDQRAIEEKRPWQPCTWLMLLRVVYFGFSEKGLT